MYGEKCGMPVLINAILVKKKVIVSAISKAELVLPEAYLLR